MNRWFLALSLSVVAILSACAQSDSGITTSVKSKFVADDQVKALNIDVDTQDHIVTLTGTVNSPAEEAKAVQIARGTDGVRDVVNHLTVASPEPAATATTGTGSPEIPGSDASVTAEIKAKMLADPAVSGLAINVDTQGLVVTLTGNVKTQAEKARALEIARGVERVNRIEDKLVVAP